MSILAKTDMVHGMPSDLEVKLLPMEEVFADDEFNCRGKLIPMDVADLAQQIEKIGLIQPITVRPYNKGPKGTKYQIVAGYRRHMAHVINRAKEIKAIVVEGLSDTDAEIINLSENLNRQDLNMVQEAKAVAKLMMKGLTQKEIAKRLDKSTGWVQMRAAILKLPEAIKEEIKAGWIKSEHIPELVRLNPEEQITAVKYIKDRKLTEGERTRVKITKASMKKDVKTKTRRDPKQINIMLEHVLDYVGAGFATRALAWAAGNITTEEFYQDIAEECAFKDKTYFPPNEDITL